jgi:hypothetical protein
LVRAVLPILVMSMDEALYGTNDPVEISRRTRPSYSETGEAYYFVDDQARPFIDEEGYRVDLGADARSRGMAGQYFEQDVPRIRRMRVWLSR